MADTIALLALPWLFLAGCESGDAPATSTEPEPDESPALEVRDGANGGHADFFWLEPLQPDPSGDPNFDQRAFDPDPLSALELTIDHVRLDGCRNVSSGFPLRFTSSSGPGSETVRVDAENERYQVDWVTDAGRRVEENECFRITVSALVEDQESDELGFVDVRFIDDDEVETAPGGREISFDADAGLPIRFRIEEGAVAMDSRTVDVALQAGRAASATLSPDAPTSIATTGADGTEYTLTVPEGALLSPIDVTITPIDSLGGSSRADGFVAGVHLEPEGLSFFQPATLEIVLPDTLSGTGLIGFGYRSTGDAFHLAPISLDGSLATLQLSHFSGGGVSEAPEDCTDVSVDGLSAEEAAKEVVSCLQAARVADPDFPNNVTAADEELIQGVLNNWFYEIVSPSLDAAVGCLRDAGCSRGETLLRAGIYAFFSWRAYLQTVGVSFSFGAEYFEENVFAAEVDSAWANIETGIRVRHEQLEAACTESTDRAEKKSLAFEILEWQAVDDALGRDIITVTVPSVCDGFLKTVPRSVAVAAEGSLAVGETQTLTATVTSWAETEIDDADLSWASSDPAVASVAASGPNEATITGLARGSVVVTATVEGVSGSLELDVASGTVIRGRIWLDDGDETFEADADEPVVRRVKLTSSGGGWRQTVTGETGLYRFEDVFPGDYTLSLPGFTTPGTVWLRRSAEVSVEVGEEVVVNFIGMRVSKGLVSHWPGEGSGEDVTGLNDGGSPPDLAPGYAPGVVGQAFQFDASGGVLEGPALGFDNELGLTVEAWVNPAPGGAVDAIQRYVTIRPAKAVLRQDAAYPEEGRRLEFYINIGGGFETGDPPPDLRHLRVQNALREGCFQHVVGTYDGDELRLYLNGDRVRNDVVPGSLAPGEGFHFSSNPEEPLVGLLDEVKVYRGALDWREVRSHYEALADAPSVCPPTERFEDLGTFGAGSARAHDVSNNGDILIEACGEGIRSSLCRSIYLPKGGGPVDLEAGLSIPDLYRFQAYGINDSGTLVACKYPRETYSDGSTACLWSPGGGLVGIHPTEIDTNGVSEAWAVNDVGTVVGKGFTGDYYVWNRSGFFAALPGPPTAINNLGEVIGTGFLWTSAGTVLELQAPWDDRPAARGMNDYSDIVGVTAREGAARAFRLSGGVYTDLGVLPTGSYQPHYSRAIDINDSGIVVGYSNGHAFFWTEEDGMVDIHPDGYWSSVALAINDEGVVVGWVQDADGERSAARWRLECAGCWGPHR